MLMPSILDENLFNDWFDFPSFGYYDDTEKKLYGKHADRIMRTDVRETEDHYLVDIDLPGFKKEDIKLELEKGYLTVTANKGVSEEEKDNKGKLIRQERYSGSMQRSFYVGENLTEEDIIASYKDGVLNINLPKKEKARVPEKKTIMIEG
ncbi:MAG: Hsp20/alpha crystallin family protein [Butyrivibrio sp.]|jgi:HSP20 family molecular chaperone IbpA|nr:Hsp20/alpha crystallin family protein [Butyrivibrio sp.]